MNVADLGSRRTREREFEQAEALGRAMAHDFFACIKPFIDAVKDEIASLTPEQNEAGCRAFIAELAMLDGSDHDAAMAYLEQILADRRGPPPAV